MSITEFLEARLDERERELRRLVESISKAAGVAFAVEGGTVEWSVERELADIAAKRAIVEQHADTHECTGPTLVSDPGLQEGDYGGPCTTLRLLAGSHVDHPDFDPAWKM